MRLFNKKWVLLILVSLITFSTWAQNSSGPVILINKTDKIATFTSQAYTEKKKECIDYAIQNLFNTLFYTGVAGFLDGKPIITDYKKDYLDRFMLDRYKVYSGIYEQLYKPNRESGRFEVTVKVTVPIENLFAELKNNGVYEDKSKLVNIDEMEDVVLPTIMVVPYKTSDESYDNILKQDYERRIAVSKLQDGFESRDIKTIDVAAKITAMKRRGEYEANSVSSNDKNLLLTSGADVYVEVDIKKDVQSSGTARASVIMKAYETSSGTILANKDGFTNTFRTTAIDQLCSYAVEDNLDAFLDDICKNFNAQVQESKRVVLMVSIGESSMASMDDMVGPNNYSLSNVIRQWVRANSVKGKYHLQGIVSESMIFDYIMIPVKDSDGIMMDAAQYAFLIQSYLIEEQNVSCSTKVDGNTIYLTIN